MLAIARSIPTAFLLGIGMMVDGMGLERAACGGPPSRVTVRRVPSGGIQPQVAVDEQGTVHLISFRGKPEGGDLYYTRSADGGRTFSPPLRVN
jgi:hypothetical protein